MLLLLKVDEEVMRESMHAAAAAAKSLQSCPTLCDAWGPPKSWERREDKTV